MQSRFGPWLRRPLRQSIRPLGPCPTASPCCPCATSTSCSPARPRANRPASIPDAVFAAPRSGRTEDERNPLVPTRTRTLRARNRRSCGSKPRQHPDEPSTVPNEVSIARMVSLNDGYLRNGDDGPLFHAYQCLNGRVNMQKSSCQISRHG